MDFVPLPRDSVKLLSQGDPEVPHIFRDFNVRLEKRINVSPNYRKESKSFQRRCGRCGREMGDGCSVYEVLP